MAVSYFKASFSKTAPLNPPKSETAPHPGWQDGTILEPGVELQKCNIYEGDCDNLFSSKGKGLMVQDSMSWNDLPDNSPLLTSSSNRHFL